MPKARTSLVFKGPTNPTRRPQPPSSPRLPKKKKHVLPSSDDDQEVEVEVEVVSDNKRGKRKAVELAASNRSNRIKVDHYEANIAHSTVEKNWKPLSQESQTELIQLANQIETEMRTRFPASSNLTKAQFRELVSTYKTALTGHLANLDVPPFPATLKPRSSSGSQDSITLLDPDFVKAKIETTRRNLEKEEKLIKELESELKKLKRRLGRDEEEQEEEEDDEEEDEENHQEEEEEDDLVVLPVKKKQQQQQQKKKKIVKIVEEPTATYATAKFSAASSSRRGNSNPVVPITSNSKSLNPPRRSAALSSSSKTKTKTNASRETTRIAPRPRPPRPVQDDDDDDDAGQDSDDFDTFPSLPKPKPKPKPKTTTKKRIESSATTKTTTKRPSLAGKKVSETKGKTG